MKNLYKIYLITLFVILLSCEEKLDVIPQGSFSDESFWKTESDAEKAILGVYSSITSERSLGADGIFGRGYYWLQCVGDDMVIGKAGKSNVEKYQLFDPSIDGSETRFHQLWQGAYIIIKRANDVLRNISKVDIDQKLKDRVLGEAYFLSGFAYFLITPIYGDDAMGVPILDEENPENFNVPRAKSASENYAHITKLLTKAVELLPDFSELKSEDYGRAHKTAALAFLAKTYLYAKKYKEAEETTQKIISSGKHSLLPKFTDVFTVANNWSKEYIWSIVSKANPPQGSMMPGVMLETNWGYNGWNYFKPTKNYMTTLR